MQISETDLILNPDGSVYHLNLRPEQIAETIIVVGDQDRVPMVSKYFDSVEFIAQKREFVTHTGYLGGKKISVISSGIGTDNVEILMNELDALVNIDFDTRKVKGKHTTLNIIRIGTSGSLQSDIPVDSFVVSERAIGIDGLNDFYEIDEAIFESNLCNQLKNELNLRVQPYEVNASEALFKLFFNQNKENFFNGITLTCAGFYAPQGRTVRYKSRIPGLLQKLQNFRVENANRLTNLEMETAGYYLFGQLLGHEMLSLNAILANRITNRFSKIPDKQVDTLIQFALEKVKYL